jgi:hypothetical protein
LRRNRDCTNLETEVMTAFRRHLRRWAAAWIVFQAVSLCASVPLDALGVRELAAGDRELSCHTKIPAPCPMRAAGGLPCPMHRGTVHDTDQRSRDICSMRGTCDAPVAALFALLWTQGVVPHASETLPDPSQYAVALLADEHPHSRHAPPDSPPPRS